MNAYIGYIIIVCSVLCVGLLAVIARFLSKPVQLQAGTTAIMLPDKKIVLLHRIPIQNHWTREEVERAMNSYKARIEKTPWYGSVNHVFLPDDGTGRGGIEALSLDKQTTQKVEAAFGETGGFVAEVY